jgi:L-threonylcarbamoyladenylate synthase
VYAAKGRPADHPLIVHVRDAAALEGWVGEVPGYALRLVRALWPGPLTLVVPRGPRAGNHLTGGQDTVGLRAPDHPVAQAVLAGFGGGIAAPSANRFGRVSPTSAADVLEELSGALVEGLDVVLDGGPSRVGLESTILDCTGERPVVLRPGAIGPEQVAQAGRVEVDPAPARPTAVRAPGTLPAHYAPAAVVTVADAEAAGELLAVGVRDPQAPVRPLDGLLAPAATPTPDGVVRLAAPEDDSAYAHALYRALREADALGLARVVAVPPTGNGPLAAAISDRLRRAASGSGGTYRTEPLSHAEA